MHVAGRTKKILLLAVLVAAVFAIRAWVPEGDLTLETLKRERDVLLAAVQDRYLLSVAAYISLYILMAALSIPGAAIMTLAGGYLFGVLPATLYVAVGATTGATLAFLVSRYLLGSWLQTRYSSQLKRFNEEIARNGARYMLTLRLIPVFPFFLINALSGFTNIPLRTFIWTTALGMIPASVVFAYAGRQFGSINSVSEVLSPRILAAFAALALFALLPAVLERRKIGKNASSHRP